MFMTENLIIALQITAIGMGLVFAAIILLWGLMALLVRLAKDPAEPGEEAAPAPAAETAPDAAATLSAQRRRAAVIAVAVAIQRQKDTTLPHEYPLPPTALVSAWQAVMRSRILSKRGPTR